MNAITTSLAKARYDPDKNWVSSCFQGYAVKSAYRDSLNIIFNIGIMNRTNTWFFEKNKLSGLPIPELLAVIEEWAFTGCKKMWKFGLYGKCKIYLVSVPIYHAFKNKLILSTVNPKLNDYLDIKFFKSERDVLNFYQKTKAINVQKRSHI